MNKLLRRTLFAAMLLTVPAAADAPRNPPQYAQFDSDSATISDNFTKLEWDRRGVIQKATFDIAKGGCAVIGSLSPTGRLPSIKELLTIVDEEPHTEYEFGKLVQKMIDALAFGDTPVDAPYWSSTPAGANQVWTLSFSTGAMTRMSTTDTTMKANARCVH